ncbi:hypothetical protein LWI29_026230 [Acer saccharum]|uniref:Uncharacterized protein n=1 Tax=Acer saccharum TaxID=4024 RepID=A0AA39T5T8_ACESA|nr:hypothetical protein LWI29_026230 [Acer saccharum]
MIQARFVLHKSIEVFVEAFHPTSPGHRPGVVTFPPAVPSVAVVGEALPLPPPRQVNDFGPDDSAVKVESDVNMTSPPATPSAAVVGEALPSPAPRHADDYRSTGDLGPSPGGGH